MNFTNKKDFFAAMQELNENKAVSLATFMPTLSSRFLDKAKEIKKTDTLAFNKKMLYNIAYLVASIMLIIIGAHDMPDSSQVFEAVTKLLCIFFGLVLMLWFIVSLRQDIYFEWEIDYEVEAYFYRNEMSEKILIELEAENISLNQKIKELIRQQQIINQTSTSEQIRSILKGSAPIHHTDYMEDEGIIRYWNDIEKPRMLKEVNQAIDEFMAELQQITKEIEFCKKLN